MTGKRPADDGTVYLQVMAQYEGRGAHWNVFQVSDQSPRITLAGSVDSCEQARRLATRAKRPLRISPQAWQQMLAAGVAPAQTPEGVTIA